MIPAYSKSTVEVTYLPTGDALKDLGDEPCGYILGYLSIDEQVCMYVCVRTLIIDDAVLILCRMLLV